VLGKIARQKLPVLSSFVAKVDGIHLDLITFKKRPSGRSRLSVVHHRPTVQEGGAL